MNDTVWLALIGLLGTIVGSVITIVSQIILAKKDRINQFRLAALEKRLKVHQEAYKLWRDMFFGLYDERIHEIAYKSEEWWFNNCLYLDPKTRKAFKRATLNAPIFGQMDKNDKLKREIYDGIEELGSLIEKGVDLSPMGEEALKSVKN